MKQNIKEQAMRMSDNSPVFDIWHGDCLNRLKDIESNIVDLIITSPPYADQRKSTYGGIAPDSYVEWFLPIANELRRVLKPDGTFILNIKEKVVSGQRHPYVLKLILALMDSEWIWTEEFIWHKKTSVPGKWPNRFRDAWERCLQFNKQKAFSMYQDAVKIPIGDWANTRLKNLSDADKSRHESDTKSGFGRNMSNWVGKDTVYPTNVLHMAAECGNKNHSAAFPKALPEWFIKLFTQEGDFVLDPFAGSGTTLFAARELNRNSLGIEIDEQYVRNIKSDYEYKYNIGNTTSRKSTSEFNSTPFGGLKK
jgi:site-specific DNA-methyltransferase (adenine-specific)/site-specific DNA-methyltransferase (cytosine-N4-specific)